MYDQRTRFFISPAAMTGTDHGWTKLKGSND